MTWDSGGPKRHVAAYKWVNRWVHKIIAVSESIKRLVISEEGVPEEKIEVIYNGINLHDTRHMTHDTCFREKLGIKKMMS